MSFDVKLFLKNLTQQPGVYRMFNDENTVIYVGKARNLKKRVSSYFTKSDLSAKTRRLVSLIDHIEVNVTNTETEALLLEQNLIKTLKPIYNVLYRDDKSYPYIFLSSHPYPRLSYYRGAKKEQGKYFGPFPSAGSAKESLNLMQKLFPVRQCEDSFFNNRSRPCLQYQIKRCSAPCVEIISGADYAEHVKRAELFLEGKNNEVIDELVEKMTEASSQLNYELAAQWRDQIAALRTVTERQYITGDNLKNVDVIAVVEESGAACVTVFYIRQGRNLGSKNYFPNRQHVDGLADLLSAFIAQFYTQAHQAMNMPDELLVNMKPADNSWLTEALEQQHGRKISISYKLRGERAQWQALAQKNASNALSTHLLNKANLSQRFEALRLALELAVTPQRIECFDISHTMGEETVASCVVCDANGMLKSDYRRFNIKDIIGGDDYAAMRQALERRYKRLIKGEGQMPDILLIDGGKGQLSQAEAVMRELQLEQILLIGVAKGPARKPGSETLFLSAQGKPIILPADSPALHLIQQVRDEAHRFAIAGHRMRRGKKRNQSPLEEIEGLGPKRRQLILRQFGGLQGVARAGVADLAQIKGISRDLAQKIYNKFHRE